MRFCVKISIGNTELEFTGEWDKGERMVYKTANGDGYPGSPAEITEISSVYLVDTSMGIWGKRQDITDLYNDLFPDGCKEHDEMILEKLGAE